MRKHTLSRHYCSLWAKTASVFPILLAIQLALPVCVQSQTSGDTDIPVKLTQRSKDGEFEFKTEKISAIIQTQGRYHGVSRLTEKRTGRQFVDERYSALNLFKLMSVNQVMDQPRGMERSFTAGADWVEIKWGPSEGHQGELTARYEIRPPNAIELILTVESKGHYPAYEVFLSSYFDKTLRPNIYLKPRGKEPPELVQPTFNEVFKDTLLVFPRDGHAARLCLDGRWDRNERDTPTVQLSPVRHYAYALAFVTDTELKTAVALMAKPGHVYAISSRYLSNEKGPRQTSYTAFDYALFGSDFSSGDKHSVIVRLEVIPLDDKDLSAPLKRYEAFLKENPGP